jgi:hypothetical protein
MCYIFDGVSAADVEAVFLEGDDSLCIEARPNGRACETHFVST